MIFVVVVLLVHAIDDELVHGPDVNFPTMMVLLLLDAPPDG